MGFRRYVLIASTVFMTVLSPLGAEDDGSGTKQSDALWTWEHALGQFQRAGALIGCGEYSNAKALLSDCARKFPRPYSNMAAERRDDIDYALRNEGLEGYYRFGSLGETCLRLHGHREAAELSLQAIKAHPKDHHDHGRRIAWCLVESGATEKGLSEYRKSLAKAKASDWQSYYKMQIQLLTERPQRMNDVQFAIDYIRKRYLKGFDVRKDYLGALRETKRVLPCAENEKERLSLYHLFIECLSELGDDRGRHAWEEKLLKDFQAEPETCASVYVSRGERAYRAKKLDEALLNYRKASRDYPNSRTYGIAQYNVGIILKEQQRYEEAITELDKLFLSRVDDRDAGAHIMQAYRNYRHNAALRISECYEAKKDFARALEYAVLANNKYSYHSWCGTCLDSAEKALSKRITRLQELRKDRKRE